MTMKAYSTTVTIILGRYLMSHIFLFSPGMCLPYATVHSRYCLRSRMRLGYRLHISSGGLRDNHLLRSLDIWGKVGKRWDEGRFHSACRGLLSSRFSFFFFSLSSLGSPLNNSGLPGMNGFK